MSAQPRVPAGVPTGGQFAQTHRPEAVGIELSDDDLVEGADATAATSEPTPSPVQKVEQRLAALARHTDCGPEHDRNVVSALSDYYHFARLGEHDAAEHYLLLAELRAGRYTWEQFLERDPFERINREREAAEIARAADVLRLTVEELAVAAVRPGDLVWHHGAFFEVVDTPEEVTLAGGSYTRLPVQRHGKPGAEDPHHLDLDTGDTVMGWHYRGDEEPATARPARPPAKDVIARIFPDGEPQRGRRRHKLLPQELLEHIPELYETEGTPVEDKVIHAHYFVGKADWHIAELDRETGEMFGRCDLGLGYPEWGYVRIQDLAELQGQLGLPVERELDFEPSTARELGLVESRP